MRAGSLFRRPPLAWAVVAVVYVLVDAGLGAIAFSSDDARPAIEIAAFVLALPAVVVTVGVIYVGGAMGWNLRDALPGDPMWPVATTFAALFAATAITNVMFVWLAWSTLARSRRDELARSRVSPRLR